MQPTLFINHGGGPCFVLEPRPMRAIWRALEDYQPGCMARLDERPRAMLIVSSRWVGARDAQPHEDHLLPLMVAAGAASSDAGIVDFQGHAFGMPISGFRFG